MIFSNKANIRECLCLVLLLVFHMEKIEAEQWRARACPTYWMQLINFDWGFFRLGSLQVCFNTDLFGISIHLNVLCSRQAAQALKSCTNLL